MQEMPSSFLDELPVLVWRSDPDGTITYLNSRWLAFTGRPLECDLGNGWLEAVYPEDAPAYLTAFRDAARALAPLEAEYRLRRNDGTYRWMLSKGRPLLDGAGRCLGYIGTCIDLTERKLAEQAARRQELLAGHARDTMLLVGIDGEILEANTAAERMYGYTREELLGLSIRDLRAPETHEGLAGDPAQARTTGILFETVHRRKDGSRFVVEVSAQAVVLNGEALLVSVVRDATERHRMAVQLSASEWKYRSLFDNMREGVAIHEMVRDAAGRPVNYRILDVNPAFSEHTGIVRETVVGRLATEAYGVPQPAYLREYAEVVETSRPISFETYFAPLERHFSVSAFSLGSGRFATVFADVTEPHKLEEQLRQAEKMDAVGRMAGGIAHNFNNLLTIILAHSDMLLGLETGDAVREGLHQISEAGERAARLTSQLLTFSRKQFIQPQPLDLNGIISETGGMLRRAIGEGIRLEIATAQDLKRVRADAGQMEEIVVNLVLNARDAMPDGGTLTIGTANVAVLPDSGSEPGPGGFVLLWVSDTGTGMTPEVVSHLFEPFFTTKPRGKGMGLGLSIVYGIVKQNNGEISVETEPGEGTTVRIYFPALAEAAEPAVPQPDSDRPRGRGETILLAEDDRNVRELVSVLLTGLGYRVIAASNGAEALELASREGPIDLLLTDVVMPGMSGPELTAALRAARPDLAVLFVSGYPDASVHQHGIEPGAETFLQKPFTTEMLSRRVRRLLDGA